VCSSGRSRAARGPTAEDGVDRPLCNSVNFCSGSFLPVDRLLSERGLKVDAAMRVA
jgi:hypothetical protein